MRPPQPSSVSKPPNGLQAVVFDLGGVITTGLAEAMTEVLSKHPSLHTAWLSQVQARWSPLYRQASLGQLSADELGRQLPLDECSGSLSAEPAEAERLEATHLRELDIAQTLAALQRRCRLGLLSNQVGRRARALLDRFALSSFFQAVVISSGIGARKAGPLPYRHLCRLLQIAPQQAAYVADEEEDLVGCQSVGMFPIFIAGQDISSRVGWVIQRLSDLVGLVQSSLESVVGS